MIEFAAAIVVSTAAVVITALPRGFAFHSARRAESRPAPSTSLRRFRTPKSPA